jgi:hypothetical protein
MLPAEERAQLPDTLDVDDARAVDAQKFVRVELFLHGRERLLHHVRGATRVQVNVFIVGLNPVDGFDFEKDDARPT